MADMARRKTFATLAALSFVAFGLSGAAARADRVDAPTPDAPVCGAYDELRAMLAERFGAHPASAGLAQNGMVMQALASATAGTWTMVTIEANGRACVFAIGRNWEQQTALPGSDEAA
jgi:hypothetical protein